MANEGNRPVRKFTAGGVGVALWKNKMRTRDGPEVDVLSVNTGSALLRQRRTMEEFRLAAAQ